MMRPHKLAFAALVVGSTALSQVTSIQSDNAGPRGGQNLNRVVCEIDSRTGTRLDTRRICKTVLEWDQLRRDHREGLEAFQRQGTSVGCPDGRTTC